MRAAGSRSGGTWLLAVVAAGVFFAADDQTSIVAILPAIIDDTGITADQFHRISWVINAYLLGYLVALPIVGRVADVYGHARIFAAALGIFMLGSALVAVAPNYEWLVAARALQAVGGGGVVPVAMAIVVGELPPARRVLGLGAIAAASEAGALLGPLWGGGITELWGWRAVFWINLPMTAPLALAAWRLASHRRERGVIDWAGAALLGAALAALTVAFTDDPQHPRPLLVTIALLALVAALAGLFVRREQRVADPLIRLSIFRARPARAALFASLLVGVGLIVALMLVPLFANLVLLESPIDGGVTLMRLTVAVPLGAIAGGWLASRLGLRATVSLGMALAALGFAGLQAWSAPLSEGLRSGPQLVAGFGFGLVIAPLGAALLQQAGEGERATAAAWLTLSRVTGMLLGAALVSSQGLGRFYTRAGSIEFTSPAFSALVAEAQQTTFREIFIVAGVVMLAGALIAWGIGAGREERAADPWWTVT